MIFPPQLVQMIKVGESLFLERMYDEKELRFQWRMIGMANG